MLDLPGHPLLDKNDLIGGCARLSYAVDSGRLVDETAQIPAAAWVRRVGRHQGAEAVYLRGHAPAEGDKPIEDRPALSSLVYTRTLIHDAFGAPPMRCLIARLPAGGSIVPHVDQGPYFGKTVRLHVPILSNQDVWMYCAGRSYQMSPGEVWALNNSSLHGVLNAHGTMARVHLICDFMPAPPLLDMLATAERSLGRHHPFVEARLAQALQGLPAAGRA